MIQLRSKRVYRVAAYIFSFIIAAVAICPGFAGLIRANADDTSNYLEGWRVDVAWNTLSTDYDWNATTNQTRQPKMYVLFRVDNAERTYNPGDLTFIVPGVDRALRGGMQKAQDNAADDTDGDWNYTWDEETATYTFKNNFTLYQNESMNGGFEFMWTFNARGDRNEFTWHSSPIFAVSGATTNQITLPEMSYTFTSQSDRYRISMSDSHLAASSWDSVDHKNYVWYDVDTRFECDYLARGLYRSSYFVYFDLPEGCSKDDLTVQYGSTTVTLETNEEGKLGFYLWNEQSGDISTSIRTIRVGFKKDKLDGKPVTVHGHLDRLYNDETDWITTAGDKEQVDAEVTIGVSDYGFSYNFTGYGYGLRKTGPYSYASPYQSRLHSSNLYNDTVLAFNVYGSANRNYSTSTISLDAEDDALMQVSSINADGKLSAEELSNAVMASPGATYGEIYGNEQLRPDSVSNEIMTIAQTESSSGSLSGIGENDPYDLIVGDDNLAITLKSGIREFQDDEYDIDYVKVPSTRGYQYEVFAAEESDLPFEKYVSVYSSTDGAGTTVRLPAGYKAAFVRVKSIKGSFGITATFGVKLHFNWDKNLIAENPIDSEGNFVNFGYMRALYEKDEQWYDDVKNLDNYTGSYGAELKKRDEEIYGYTLFRDYSDVYLRTSVTNLNTKVDISNLVQPQGMKQWNGTLSATGSVRAEDESSLTSFSLYVQVPDGIRTDFYNDKIDITGSAVLETGESFTNFADYVSISERTYDGHNLVAFDFDFSNMPIKLQELTSISVKFPIYLYYADFVTAGTYYSASSYFMVHDGGLDKIVGTNISQDIQDIDEDGSNKEILSRSSDYTTISDTVSQWSEQVDKYVKTPYSDGYGEDGIVHVYGGSEDETTAALSDYSYRLDYVIGSGGIKNIVFYDSIERGADITEHSDEENADTVKHIESSWQGTLKNIDVSNLIKQGLKVTYYWSEDPDMANKSTSGVEPKGLATDAWNEASSLDDVDKSKIKSFAVKADTSNLNNGMFFGSHSALYIIVNMQAPSDSGLVNRNAVNQYTVTYDGYNPITGESLDSYTLSSNATQVTLREGIGDLILQKVDADNILRYDTSGEPVYAKLTEGQFNIYREIDGRKELVEGSPFSVNSLGRIVLRNAELGKYYIEEIEAPRGYQKLKDEQEVVLTAEQNVFDIPNKRIPGEVILTKNDAQFQGYGPLEGATFELYTSSGTQIMTDSHYVYSEDTGSGAIGEFTTDELGQIHITGLPWGSYYFLETTAPTGYEINPNRVIFNVDKSNYVSDESGEHVIAEVTANNNEQTASIRLVKSDKNSGKGIEDARFSLYRVKRGDEEEDVLIREKLYTNVMGEIEVNDLPFGTYYFKETRNSPGYLMPEEGSDVTDTVTLDKNTAGETKIVKFTNERMKGSVQLMKFDDFDQNVAGAEYELFYKSDTSPDGEYISKGKSTTSGEDGTFIVNDLDWGDYYFVETKAPKGYALSEDHVEFTIDKETVQNQLLVKAYDERARGSVKVIKIDKSDKTTLEGAEFDLFNINGVKMTPGIDYQTSNENNKIITDGTGTVTISGLLQNGYYLQETKAPDGYSKLADPIRFSVTLANSGTVQELRVENEKGKAYITVHKTINEVYEGFGNPTFIFTVTGSDGHVYTKSITLTKEQLSGEVTFTVESGDTYTVRELNSTRYQLVNTESPNGNVTINDITSGVVLADLTTESSADITYTNNITQYEKYSDTISVINIVKRQAKLTGLHVDYVGPSPLNSTTVSGKPGWSEDDEIYTFKPDDMVVTVFYDDGTSKVLKESEYELSPNSVHGSATGGDTSATVDVSYTEGDITVHDSFQLSIDLPPYVKRYTVIIDCAGGTIEPDENWMTN